MTNDQEVARTDDLTNLGMSTDAHRALRSLRELGVFAEMADGYRLGAALALALRVQPEKLDDRQNVFGVATIDPSGKLRSAVEATYDTDEASPYRWIERLADWGVRELERRMESGRLDLSDVVNIDGS